MNKMGESDNTDRLRGGMNAEEGERMIEKK